MNTKTKTLVIVGSAILSHVCNWCIVGVCDAVLQCLEASFGSTAFTLGVALMLSQYAKFPAFLQKPSKCVLYVYYILMSSFVSSLSMRLIWMPLTESVAEINVIIGRSLLCIDKMLNCRKKSAIKKFAQFFETKTALTWSTNVLGAWFLYWVAESLNVLKKIMCVITENPCLKKLFEGCMGKSHGSMLRRRGSGKRRGGAKRCGIGDILTTVELDSAEEDEDQWLY